VHSILRDLIEQCLSHYPEQRPRCFQDIADAIAATAPGLLTWATQLREAQDASRKSKTATANMVASQALDLLVQQREARHTDALEVSLALSFAALAHGDLGDAAQSRELLERALKIKEREYGPEHREVAITLTNLGNAHGDLGEAAQQRELLERALTIMEREYGPEHRYVGIVLRNLSQAHGALGDAAQQQMLLERASLISTRMQ